MYAVIESGGKQYRVQPGDIVQVEKLDGETGKDVSFTQVLFTSKMNPEAAQVTIGKPYLSGAKVDGEIVGQGRGEKVMIVKMKRRKQYRRTQGHRQFLTQILVTAVDNGAGDKAALSAEDKKAKLAKFQSHLKPRGPAFSNPYLVKKVRSATAPVKAAAPKAAAPAEADAPVKTAAKKTSSAPKTEAKKAPAKKTTAKK